MSDRTKTFNLTNFSPIGFKKPNYPTQYCLLCRGYLTEVCNTCSEHSREVCPVINNNDTYYHSHCFNFMNSTKPTN